MIVRRAALPLVLVGDIAIDQVRLQAVSSATDFSFDFQDLLLKPAR